MSRSRANEMMLLDLEERLRAAEAFQRRLVARRLIPDTRKLLIRRLRFVLETVGGLVLGVLAAVVGVILTFLVFNLMLHI
jgi:hypothetical protein